MRTEPTKAEMQENARKEFHGSVKSMAKKDANKKIRGVIDWVESEDGLTEGRAGLYCEAYYRGLVTGMHGKVSKRVLRELFKASGR